MNKIDPLTYWRSAVERAAHGDYSVPLDVYESDGEAGFYAIRKEANSKTFLPVCVDSDLSITVAGHEVEHPREIWERAVKFPITAEEYLDLMEEHRNVCA